MITDELVATINANRRKTSWWPVAMILALFLWPAIARINPVASLFWPMMAIAAVVVLRRKDDLFHVSAPDSAQRLAGSIDMLKLAAHHRSSSPDSSTSAHTDAVQLRA